MKRWEYSAGWKTLAVILNQVCAVILVLSVIICTLYAGSSGFSMLEKDNGFESTAYYQTEVEKQIYRCIRAASRESKFENNGTYDAKLVVDIQEYMESGRILHGAAGEDRLCYKLADLLNWSLDAYEISTLLRITYEDGTIGYISQGEVSRSEQSVYDEEGKAVSSTAVTYGADVEIYGVTTAAIQNVEQIEAVAERYAPVGYTSVVEYAQQKNLSAQELQNMYLNLESALSAIYNDYYAYKENLELFSPSMTNMRYIVIPQSAGELTEENYEQKTWTNIKNFGSKKISEQEILDYIREQRSYLIFDSSDMSFDSRCMPASLSDISSYLKEYAPSVDGDYILAIAVDSEYLASDALQGYKQQYEEVRPLSRAAIYGALLGSVLYLLTLVYLTLAVGRSTDGEDRTVRLNGFDRIKTELAAMLLLLPAFLVLGIGLYFKPVLDGVLQASIWGGSLTFGINLLFVAGYLSLVRRMKSRTLWSNSILCVIVRLFSNMFHNRKATTRTAVLYLIFLIVNFILLCFGTFGLLLALIFDFAVGTVLIQQALQRQRILEGLKQISEGNLSYQIPREGLSNDNLKLADAVNHIGEGLSMAVEQSVKDERLKSDLITNVSHDIKTPLTSIINYVDLLKREDIQNERAKNYIAILEDKSQRLKHLTDDLVEASKISSGNIKLEFTRINFQELIQQTNGEFCEKFEDKGLQLVVNMPKEPVVIEADGRRLWRIIENLYNNAAKYAMPNTRVYVDLTVVGHMVRFSIKNISEQPLNIQAEELTERFIRGDVARSTEGSGLGLSIAKNLTELQKGTFDIYLDGDLFKITIIFPEAPQVEREEAAEENQSPEHNVPEWEALEEEGGTQSDFEVPDIDN